MNRVPGLKAVYRRLRPELQYLGPRATVRQAAALRRCFPRRLTAHRLHHPPELRARAARGSSPVRSRPSPAAPRRGRVPERLRRRRLPSVPALRVDGEALAAYLGAAGIRTRVRTMERAAFFAAWRERKLRGVIMSLSGAGGNAATRIEAYVTRGGAFSSGVVPEIEELFQRETREIDRAKREGLVHRIQRVMQERVMHAPVFELGPMVAVGPRVDQGGVGLIAGYPYTAPYENMSLK